MSTESPTGAPIKPIATDTVPWTVFDDVPNFGVRYRHLSRAARGDDYRIGVAIEELPPGMQTAPAHYHCREEEHLFILEGSLTLRLGGASHPMRAGDYACFPAGQKAGHCLVNTGTAPCRYVIVGENDPQDVVVYTDSNKVLVRALGPRALLDLAAVRNYWDGENTGLPRGEQPAPDGAIQAADPGLAPQPPIASDSVPWEEHGVGAEFGGGSRHLTHAAVKDGWHVGMLIESPSPGKRLWPLHYHMLEEEHVLMLEGEATLLLGAERHAMKPGDYVCFPAGQRIGHAIRNSGSGPCRYLMIGARNPNEVCVYPDSNKLAVDALRPGESIFDMASTRRYWDGEA